MWIFFLKEIFNVVIYANFAFQHQNGRNTFSFMHLQQNYKTKTNNRKKIHCLFLLGFRRSIEILKCCLFCSCLLCILLLLEQLLLINKSQQIAMYWAIVCKKKKNKLNRRKFAWNSISNSHVFHVVYKRMKIRRISIKSKREKNVNHEIFQAAKHYSH